MKVIVVYESMFGNTKRAAELIVGGINETEKTEVVIKEQNHVKPKDVLDYDLVLIGSPKQMGGPTRGIKKFIDKLGKLGLEGKKGAVFDTYVKKNIGKAVRKMEKRINEKVSGLKLVAPGLPVKVQGIRGLILDEEIPKSREFGKKIAEKMKI